jgi:methionyl-tRNA synthetase
VLGTCPHCGHSEARGDQCDGCGSLLDPDELIAPRSALSGDTALEIRPTRHLFLRQSRLVETLRSWIDQRNGWPSFVVSTAKGWLTAELRDRCITRDLAWGIPVPRAGFESKVFYVWFDAPIGYIAATQEWAEAAPGRDWQRWWWNADDVRYIQFLGKDNVPFHAVSFPATLLGSGEPWKTVDVIKGFHWLTHEGGKFSTSAQRGVFTDAALDELPADYWRWWLIANASESADTDFSVPRFVADVNKDLADVFGNLANRIISFAHSAFDGRIPEGGQPSQLELELAADLDRRIATVRRHHEALEFRAAAAETRAIWSAANAYLQQAAPWVAIKSDRIRAAVVTRTGLNLVRLSAVLAWSIIPELSAKVLSAFEAGDGVPDWPIEPCRELFDRDAGHPVEKLAPTVAKIGPDKAAHLAERFGAA